MCDRIIMPNGEEIDTFDGGKSCLCPYTHLAVLTWIVEHLEEFLPEGISFDHIASSTGRPESMDISIGTEIKIERDPFGWIVTLTKGGAREV